MNSLEEILGDTSHFYLIKTHLQMKKNQELTVTELKSKKKILTASAIVISSLILMFLVYFIIQLASSTWQPTNTLGVMVMGVLVISISSIGIQLVLIDKELKTRSSSN